MKYINHRKSLYHQCQNKPYSSKIASVIQQIHKKTPKNVSVNKFIGRYELITIRCNLHIRFQPCIKTSISSLPSESVSGYCRVTMGLCTKFTDDQKLQFLAFHKKNNNNIQTEYVYQISSFLLGMTGHFFETQAWSPIHHQKASTFWWLVHLQFSCSTISCKAFLLEKTQKKSHPKKAVLRSTQKEAPSVPPKSCLRCPCRILTFSRYEDQCAFTPFLLEEMFQINTALRTNLGVQNDAAGTRARKVHGKLQEVPVHHRSKQRSKQFGVFRDKILCSSLAKS